MCVYFLKSESERPDIYLRKYWHESESEHGFYNFGMKMKNKFITEMHTRNLAPADLKKSLFVPEIQPFEIGIIVRPNFTM